MEKNCKLIEFDIKKAKTPSNPNGLEVVTKDATPATIISTDFRSLETYDNGNSRYPIVAMIHDEERDSLQFYQKDGTCRDYHYELCLKKPTPQRRMTNRELAGWLKDNPKEHREFKYNNCDNPHVFTHYDYPESIQNLWCDSDILVRCDGGEWHEPLIDEN